MVSLVSRNMYVDIYNFNLIPQYSIMSCKFQHDAKNIFELKLGTIHLRRRHFLGGRGQKLAKFADG
jgi:hypothetical protein